MSIELTKQYVILDSGTTVLVEAHATESGQIFYIVDNPTEITSEEYEQAIHKISPAAERAMRSRIIFG